MPTPLIPVIMCGGAGTRLWPVSRESMPKQFVSLIGQDTTFQQVLARISDPQLFARPIIITNADFRFVVAEQLRERNVEADIVLEPMRRDSGPAVAVAAVLATQRDATRWCSCSRPITSSASPTSSGRLPERSASCSRRPHRNIRNKTHLSGDKLWLHPSRRASSTAHTRMRSTRSSKSRMQPQRRLMWRSIISGTAGIFCSTPRPCWPKSSNSSRPWRRRPRPQSQA